MLIWKQIIIFVNITRNDMAGHTITIILSDEANSFVRQQPFKAQQKIAYNIRRVQSGLIEKDVFKKLENSDIWAVSYTHLTLPTKA